MFLAILCGGNDKSVNSFYHFYTRNHLEELWNQCKPIPREILLSAMEG